MLAKRVRRDVSIIIPALNEESTIQQTLQQLTVLNPPPHEVIVIDAGSEDETVDRVKTSFELFSQSIKTKIIFSSKRGRSIQMNQGADIATGDILCFLHADTWLPNDAIAIIQKTLTDPKVAAGGFISLMVGSNSTRWGISLHNYLKTYYAPLIFKPLSFWKGLRLLFGDQVIFCRRNDFWECGGFDDNLPIMEDGNLCCKLARKGRIRLVNRIVQSSDRRVARWGAWKATAIYIYIGVLWGIGVDANYLKRFYQDIR